MALSTITKTKKTQYRFRIFAAWGVLLLSLAGCSHKTVQDFEVHPDQLKPAAIVCVNKLNPGPVDDASNIQMMINDPTCEAIVQYMMPICSRDQIMGISAWGPVDCNNPVELVLIAKEGVTN